MSTKRPSNYRGPSKPLDTRRGVPRTQVKRRGIDPFGMALIGFSAVIALLIILYIATRSGNGVTPTTAGVVPGTTVVSIGGPASPTSSDPSVQATAAEVAFQTQVADVPRLSLQETKSLLDAKSIKLIDVRAFADYQKEHIAGAVSIPQADVTKRIKELPKTGATLVFYCECPNDEESAGTAKGLANSGYSNVKVVRGPYALSQWKQAGYPTEASGQ